MMAKGLELKAGDTKELADHPTSGRAYRKLIKAGAKAEELERSVGVIVSTYWLPRSFDALAVPGMSRRQVDEFPNELRSVARKVEVIAKNPHFGDLETVDSRAELIASWLRSYADHCEDVIKSFRSWLKKNPRYFDLQSIFKLKLLRYVKSSTGRWHFQAVANLVNGALEMTDFGEFEPDVSPAALRQLVKREAYKEDWRKRQ